MVGGVFFDETPEAAAVRSDLPSKVMAALAAARPKRLAKGRGPRKTAPADAMASRKAKRKAQKRARRRNR